MSSQPIFRIVGFTGDRHLADPVGAARAITDARPARHEAAEVIDPVVKFERETVSRGHGDLWVPVEVAGALYAQALTKRSNRTISAGP